MNILTYCLKCKKNTKNIDAKMMKIKNGRFMLSSNVLYMTVKNQNL